MSMIKSMKKSLGILSAVTLSLAASSVMADDYDVEGVYENKVKNVGKLRGLYAMTYFESCTFSDRAFYGAEVGGYDPETGEVLEELLTIRQSSVTALVRFKKNGKMTVEGRLNAGNLSEPTPAIGETPYFHFETKCEGDYTLADTVELDNLNMTVSCDIDVGDDTIDVVMGPIKLSGTVGRRPTVISLSKPNVPNVFERTVFASDGESVIVNQQKQCIATATLNKL